LEFTQSPLQKHWSAQNSTAKMANFCSEQLPTPIFLEWTAVYSIFFGVDTFPLQNFGVHVVKVWSAFSLTHSQYPANILLCLSFLDSSLLHISYTLFGHFTLHSLVHHDFIPFLIIG
jgi:hypothetical protein